MRPALPIIMSITGGYVDTAGFLALHGLFTGHVTGNIVMLGAALLHEGSSTYAKMLAVPVFCATIVIMRFVIDRLRLPESVSLRTMVAVKLVMLTLGSVSAISLAPFTAPNGLSLVLTGMLLVIAMAIQNAAHRTHLASAPPSNVMTGTMTQMMVDLGEMLAGRMTPDAKVATRARLKGMLYAVLGFVTGCGAAALGFGLAGTWCFALPPFLGLATLLLVISEPTKQPE
ncbi:uncharacterized membrane protein YoaK (UPF0700 family) [Rhizobium sp. BK251]|nr:uncharacterized membrane protein YoaK (UPF0700 family) [Rhizobium sp. BK251]